MRFQKASIITGRWADPVADVLETVAEFRAASDAERRAEEKLARGTGSLDAACQARAYARELRERVDSRARSADIEPDDLLAMAEDVLDGRRRLPARYLAEAA